MTCLEEHPDLWTAAIKTLPDPTLRTLDIEKWRDAATTWGSSHIDDLIALTKAKQDQCDRNFWRFKIGDHELILRDCATKIITWLNKFKEVGDVASQYDPVHSALPWAVVRFVLQSAISEREQMGAILVIIETASRLVLRCRVYETLYTPKTINTDDDAGHGCLTQLRNDVISLYAAILRALAHSYSLVSKNTIKRAAKAIIRPGRTKEILDELTELSDHVKNQARLCESKRSQKASGNLERLLQSLDLPLFRIQGDVAKVLTLVSEQEHGNIIEWISSIPFGAHHQAVSRQRTRGTGEWLLRHKRFVEWSSTSSSAITLLYGDPGSGKTFLVSRVVDWIRDGLKNNSTDEAFAYFYCNRNEEDRRRPETILRSLVRQLSSTAGAHSSVHKQLPALKNSLQKQGQVLDIDKCCELLFDLANSYPATTIVLDALDECEPDSRGELMTVLDDLMERSRTPLKVFISSRRDHDIRSHFDGRPRIEIRATDNQRDIADFVRDKMSDDRRWNKLSQQVRQEVEDALLEGSQGMFQWAALQMHQLGKLRVWTARSIRDRLGKLPETLESSYDEIWREIDQLSPHEKQLAERALKWVSCAFHPLTAKELTVAVLFDPESDAADEMEELDAEEILAICSNFLCIDSELQVWRFCHLSAREYYEKHHQALGRCHQFVAMACLKQLLVTPPGQIEHGVKFPRRSKLEEWHPLCQRHTGQDAFDCFCTYVTYMWPAHVRTQENSTALDNQRLKQLLKRFFGSMGDSGDVYRSWILKASTLTTAHKPWKGLTSSPLYDIFHDLRTNPIRLPLLGMCVLGIFNLMFNWWGHPDADLDIRCAHGMSLLSVAIEFKQEPVWRHLLSRKVSLELGNPIPLVQSMKSEDKVAFKALIEAGANVNAVNKGDRFCNMATPLMYSLRHNFHEDPLFFARSLVAAGADVNVILREREGRNIFYVLHLLKREILPTPLLEAVNNHRRRPEYVDFIIGAGADMNLPTPYGTALDYALKTRQWSLARHLADRGAVFTDPNKALLFATSYSGPVGLIRLCIDRGADVKTNDGFTTPLMNAASKNSLEAMNALIEAGADVNSVVQGGNGTALASTSNVEKLQFLVEAGANVNLNNGRTSPLIEIVHSTGSYNNKIRAITYLLSVGADINQILPQGRSATALVEAARAKSVDLLKFLLGVGADLRLGNAQSNPLCAAAEEWYPEAVKFLLDAGCDPNDVLDEGPYGSALAAAAFWAQDQNIILLLDGGADINLPLRSPFRTIWFAARAGHLRIEGSCGDMKPRALPAKLIKLFFERGIDIHFPLYRTLNTACAFYRAGTRGEHRIRGIQFVNRNNQYHSLRGLSHDWGHIMLELQNKEPGKLLENLRRWGFPRQLLVPSIIAIGLSPLSEPHEATYMLVRICRCRSYGPTEIKFAPRVVATMNTSVQEKWKPVAVVAAKRQRSSHPDMSVFWTKITTTTLAFRSLAKTGRSQHQWLWRTASFGLLMLILACWLFCLWAPVASCASPLVDAWSPWTSIQCLAEG